MGGKKADGWSRAEAAACAAQAEALIRSRGDYDHIQVRPHGAHLLVEAAWDGDTETIARMTHLGAQQFGLGFKTHSGCWEPMPFTGPLASVTQDLVEVLAPYLERANFSFDMGGTGH